MELIFLLVLHHFADVALQPSWLIEKKRDHVFAIYEHVMIYAGVLSGGLYVLGLFRPWMFLWFLIGHFLIDWFKYQVIPADPHNAPYWYIYPDQALHYAQVVAVLLVTGGMNT